MPAPSRRAAAARRRPLRLAGLALLLLAAAPACDRNIEPFADDPVEQPDLSRIFPEAAEREVTAPGAPPPPPPPPPGRQPRGAAPSAQAAGTGPPIRGVVRLAPELEGRIPAGSVLFVLARTGEAGPPTAVLRLPARGFPVRFEIGADDRMIQALPWTGPFRLGARVDTDGNASTRAGDFEGVADGTHPPGAEGVEIVIDRPL